MHMHIRMKSTPRNYCVGESSQGQQLKHTGVAVDDCDLYYNTTN